MRRKVVFLEAIIDDVVIFAAISANTSSRRKTFGFCSIEKSFRLIGWIEVALAFMLKHHRENLIQRR
jgi:hypothetical protein